ncbi:hypothetical protein L596_026823 [Steinernema carpocapsae]|nr:hypothetical protein L596_026823 [Steinernema carpocapsae]
MAVEFAKLGVKKLVLWDINENGNEETKQMVEKFNKEVHTYKIDLSNREQIATIAAQVKEDVGPVDILVNNAGYVTGKLLADSPDESIERTMAVNTSSNLYTTKAFLPNMLDQNHGHVVVVASLAGKLGIRNCVDYCTSKHGAVGFANALSAEIASMGKFGVNVTVVNPYFIDTGMFDGARTFAPRLLPILKPQYVVNRIMEAVLTNTPEIYIPRFAYFVVFFCSFLPPKAQGTLNHYFGLNYTMDHFIGRVAKNVAN